MNYWIVFKICFSVLLIGSCQYESAQSDKLFENNALVSLSVNGFDPVKSELDTLPDGISLFDDSDIDVWLSDGITLREVRLVLEKIKLQPEGKGEKDQSDEIIGANLQDNGNQGDDSNKEYPAHSFEGPYIIDLLNNTISPEPELIYVPSGLYRRAEMRIKTLNDREADAFDLSGDDPLRGNSIFVKGEYKSNDGELKTFSISYDLSEQFQIMSEVGFKITLDEDVNEFFIEFNLSDWFRVDDFKTIEIENSLNKLDDSAIVLNKDSKGVLKDIREIIQENIKKSAGIGVFSDRIFDTCSKEVGALTNPETGICKGYLDGCQRKKLVLAGFTEKSDFKQCEIDRVIQKCTREVGALTNPETGICKGYLDGCQRKELILAGFTEKSDFKQCEIGPVIQKCTIEVGALTNPETGICKGYLDGCQKKKLVLAGFTEKSDFKQCEIGRVIQKCTREVGALTNPETGICKGYLDGCQRKKLVLAGFTEKSDFKQCEIGRVIQKCTREVGTLINPETGFCKEYINGCEKVELMTSGYTEKVTSRRCKNGEPYYCTMISGAMTNPDNGICKGFSNGCEQRELVKGGFTIYSSSCANVIQ